MNTMSPKRIFLLALMMILFISSVSATIPISVTDVGCTYIQWNWTPGLDLTNLYIDGNVMCGYETTDPFYLATGLSPGELHNITIYTAGDSGTNLTRTTTENCTSPGSGSQTYVLADDQKLPLSPMLALAGILIVGIFFASTQRERKS
jgi:hypothetical protein